MSNEAMNARFHQIVDSRQVVSDALIDAQSFALSAVSEATSRFLSGRGSPEDLLFFSDHNLLMHQVYTRAIETLSAMDRANLVPEIIDAGVRQYKMLRDELPLEKDEAQPQNPTS